jgi:hypothetical protein
MTRCDSTERQDRTRWDLTRSSGGTTHYRIGQDAAAGQDWTRHDPTQRRAITELDFIERYNLTGGNNGIHRIRAGLEQTV